MYAVSLIHSKYSQMVFDYSNLSEILNGSSIKNELEEESLQADQLNLLLSGLNLNCETKVSWQDVLV